MSRRTHRQLCAFQCHRFVEVGSVAGDAFFDRLAASLRAEVVPLVEGEDSGKKQEPSDSPKSKGSNRSTSGATDGMAAGAKHDRGR
jgi:hypothetical protein